MLRFIANVLWLVLSGFWMAIGYVIAGCIMFILFFLVITIPFGIAAFRLAGYSLWPFGRTVVADPDAGAGSTIGNVLWFILAGLWIAIGHVISGILFFITIIGIPFGVASFKLAGLALFPLGKKIVSLDEARAMGQTGLVQVSPSAVRRPEPHLTGQGAAAAPTAGRPSGQRPPVRRRGNPGPAGSRGRSACRAVRRSPHPRR